MAEGPKRTKIYDFLRAQQADICLLQETHNLTKTDEDKWTREWGGQAFWSPGSHRSRGVVILINPRFTGNITKVLHDLDGRIVTIQIEHNNITTNVMNIYAPTLGPDRKTFFENLWHYKTGDSNLILGGDFNCIENTQLDKAGGNPLSGTVGFDELRDFTTRHNLSDVWRVTHPQDLSFTWNTRDFSIRSRLDRWYIPDTELTTATSCIQACPHSDHSVVDLKVNFRDGRKRGKGAWKFNNSTLQDKTFQRAVRAFWTFWKRCKADYHSPAEWWDAAKEHLKRISIRHSVTKSRNRRQQEDQLRDKLTRLHKEIRPDPDRVADVEEQLSRLIQKRLDGAKIRSRATWLEEGEKPTRFFFDLERTKQQQACISKLSTDNGEVTSDEQILNTARTFYEHLYTNDPVDSDIQDDFIRQLDRRLDERTKSTCEGPVTKDELTAALKRMHWNKSPGPDGLTVEFYQTFCAEMADEMVELFNINYLNGAMTSSQRQSLLRLLYKKGNRQLLTNWRPISLLNTDYKILSTLLANRLKPTLPDVIHEDQTCGIPNRTIFDNVLRLRDMAHEASTKNLNLILINLDQEKAFDRVNRGFLVKIMKKLNYGPSFIRWIETIYFEANCRIINNGWLSDPIPLRRGVRQGCPLSPLLYTMIIEALTNALRKDPKIEGVTIPGSPVKSKISAYADDGTLTLKDDLSATRAFDQIARFERASGSKLNMRKTEGTFVGQQVGRQHGPIPIAWKEDSVRVLGTNIGHNMDQDWETPTTKIEETLDRWSKRTLSIKGKAVILKTYAMATIIYLASMVLIPETIITRIHRACFKFLWSGKNELVCRATCHLPMCRGGLGIPDLRSMRTLFHIKRINQLTNQEQSSIWLSYGRYWTGQVLGNITDEWKWLRANNKPHGDPGKIPPWYKVLISFAQQYRDSLTRIPTTQLTSRTIRAYLEQDHQPRAEREWKRYIQPPPNFNETWKGLWSTRSDNRTKEFLWKLTHRVLTTKQYLQRWGMQVNVQCPFCQSPEDMHHAVLSCHRALTLWKDLEPLLTHIAGRTIPLTFDTLIFRRNLPHEERANNICYHIVAAGAEVLWRTRNKKVYDGNARMPNLKAQVIAELKCKIRTDFITNPARVEHLWAYRNIIVVIRNKELVFQI